MKRSGLRIAVVAAVLAMLTIPAHAQMSADQVWKKVESRIKSMRDYTLSYNYNGPRGDYVFDYAVVRPDAIKTKIVKGENHGAILIYKPNEYGSSVKARKGILGKTLALTDPQIKGTPVITPVYDMVLESTKGATGATMKGDETVGGHAAYVIEVTGAGGKNEIAVDKQTFDILRWKCNEGGPTTREFYNIQINTSPKIDF